MASKQMEKSYRLAKWLDTPGTAKADERYQQIKNEINKICKHSWFLQSLKDRKTIKVLDICGAWGIAGTAISKTLSEQGYETELTIQDIRSDSKDDACSFVERELGVKPTYLIGDATQLPHFDTKFDVCVFWGMSTPHFSHWNMLKLLSGVAHNLTDDGLMLIEEADRVYTTFLSGGYQRLFVEGGSEDEVVVSLHRGYDSRRGMVRKTMVDLSSGEKAKDEFHLWSLSETASQLWVFFEDVDFIARDPYRGVLLAKTPRRSLDQIDFKNSNPTMIVR